MVYQNVMKDVLLASGDRTAMKSVYRYVKKVLDVIKTLDYVTLNVQLGNGVRIVTSSATVVIVKFVAITGVQIVVCDAVVVMASVQLDVILYTGDKNVTMNVRKSAMTLFATKVEEGVIPVRII